MRWRFPRFVLQAPAAGLLTSPSQGSPALRALPRNLWPAERGSLPPPGANKRPATGYPLQCCTPTLRKSPVPKSMQRQTPRRRAPMASAANSATRLLPCTRTVSRHRRKPGNFLAPHEFQNLRALAFVSGPAVVSCLGSRCRPLRPSRRQVLKIHASIQHRDRVFPEFPRRLGLA